MQQYTRQKMVFTGQILTIARVVVYARKSVSQGNNDGGGIEDGDKKGY
jgi:hypothetical protein